MKRQKVFLACLLILALISSTGITAAQGGVPALPASSTNAILLFPEVIQDGTAAAGGQQQYTLLAASGDVLVVTARMSAAGLITGLQLTDASGNALVQQAASSAAPTAITLTYQATAEGWYNLAVTFGQAAGPYTLALTGTTTGIFSVFKAGPPPAVAKAHLVAYTAQITGSLETEAVPYLIPVDAGDKVGFTFQGTSQPSLKLVTFDASGAQVQAGTLGPQQSGTAFTSDKAQWVEVDVVPAQAGTFDLSISHPRASGAAQAYFAGATGLTLVPGGGNQPTQPAGGYQATPAGGQTTAANLCGGVPARFKVGDVIVVSQKGDNLDILTDYTGNFKDAIELASKGDQLEIQKDPVCYSSPYLKQDVWFWNVYSYTDKVYGWVADGQGADRWVCAANDPACDQSVPCPTPPVQFLANDMIVVSQKGDNLQLLRYPGTDQALGLAVWKQQLKVIGGPACYFSVFYQAPIIYWNVFSEKDGMAGWVADGAASERWVCPVSNPTCDK